MSINTTLGSTVLADLNDSEIVTMSNKHKSMLDFPYVLFRINHTSHYYTAVCFKETFLALNISD